MRSLPLSLLLGLLILSFSCGGNKPLTQTKASPIPDWFVNLPEDPNYLYAARTGTSRDLGLAIEKATTSARAEVARQYEVKVEGLTKSFKEEIGSTEDAEMNQLFSQTIRTITSTQLVGSKAKHVTHVKDGSNYRAYVLVEQPIGAAHDAFLKNLQSSNQAMYTRFRSSEAFKEMDEQLNKYEDWKKEQAKKYSGGQ